MGSYRPRLRRRAGYSASSRSGISSSRNGWLSTCGSDDHGSLTGYRLGCETTSEEAYQDLLSRVPGHPH